MTDQLGALTTLFTEFYYWVTVVLMFLIHVGFCMYEVGASRYKHHQHTLMKNTMLIPLVTVTWFFFCLLYTSPSPRDRQKSRMPSSA